MTLGHEPYLVPEGSDKFLGELRLGVRARRLSVTRLTADTLPFNETERRPMLNRGERLRLAMDARGVRKQHALAFQLKVHESAISRWKSNRSFSLDNAVAVCVELDISMDWLLLGRGTMDAHKRPVAKAIEIEDGHLVAPFSHLLQLLTEETSARLQALILSLLADLVNK